MLNMRKVSSIQLQNRCFLFFGICIEIEIDFLLAGENRLQSCHSFQSLAINATKPPCMMSLVLLEGTTLKLVSYVGLLAM